jgi:hypothetical protein
MRVGIAGRVRSAPATFGRLFHVVPHHETTAGTTGPQMGPSTRGPSDPTPLTLLEAPASASGVLRHDEVPLLAPYGTSYGLFDVWICDYECVLVSDVYRLADYVGDSVWVSGPLRSVIGGMPVLGVTHLELLKMRWMR